jgi:7-cyano-7-deazaguanine synthase
MKKAVVLLSGGIDSTTTLAIAKSEGYDLYAMSFDYHQRHRLEIEMARRNARRFKVIKHLIVDIDLSNIARSALTADIDVPKDRDDIRVLNEIPVTYVPARNIVFLSLALAWAETIDSEDIFIGANAIDYSGYPDCRPEFIKAFEDMANISMKAAVEGRVRFRIHAPLINMSKAQIIKKGYALGVDFSDTWSCYDPQEIDREEQKCRSASRFNRDELPNFRANYVPCGRCDSCLLRGKGFKEAGIEDPLRLKVKL